MKKLTLILVVLLTIGLVGAFAEEEKSYPMTTVAGDFQHVLTAPMNTGNPSGSFTQAEVNITGEVDEYNTVSLELDSEGGSWNAVEVDDLRFESDITGALGLDAPVTVNTTVGYFDTYFTNFAYPTVEGNEYTNWNTNAPAADGAIQVDIGIDPVTLHWWNNFTDGFGDFQVGMSGSVADANFFASYATSRTAMDEGTLAAEADYTYEVNDMTSVYVPVAFNYDLAAETYGWSSGVGADYDMVDLNVGVGGNKAEVFQYVNTDMNLAATENADVWAAAYMDLAATDAFQSAQFGASYSFGALKMSGGYAYAATDSTSVALLPSDGSITGSGVFLATDISW